MSAELWRSLQKEEKNIISRNTLFDIRPHTHPGNVSDDTKEMMKLEKGISFQIWPEKILRNRCDQMSTSSLNIEVFPWKGYHSRAPQKKARSSTKPSWLSGGKLLNFGGVAFCWISWCRNLPGPLNPPKPPCEVCLRPCSHRSRSPALRRFDKAPREWYVWFNPKKW